MRISFPDTNGYSRWAEALRAAQELVIEPAHDLYIVDSAQHPGHWALIDRDEMRVGERCAKIVHVREQARPLHRSD